MNPTPRKSVLAIMSSQLKQYTADHRYLLEVVTKQAGLAEPVAVELDEFYVPLLKAARKGPLLPIDGVLVRDWDPDNRRIAPGFQLGMRLYDLEGIRFVRVRCGHGNQSNIWGLDFIAVDRKDYRRLYKIALRCRRDSEPPSNAPVLPPEQLDQLWKNTIGYLEAPNLNRIKAYGGRARRGVLLTGAPGNGKTMACRWLWAACRPRRRETVHETEDQAVFLSALDGINVHEGVVFVFTTNCSLDLIDRAFKRPGRIDLVLNFKPPDERLRRQLIERWHEDIRGHINVDLAVTSTEGFSFAEIEELKNLLVMRCMDSGEWDWDWALKQFDVNRSELSSRPRRHVGFGA